MKNILCLLAICIAFSLGISTAQARNEALFMSIDEALSSPGSSEALSSNIQLHFSGRPSIGFRQDLGTFTANRKTNAFLKSDKTSCEWAMLSALKSLQERAIKEGGNAVINIHSYYGKNTYKSPSQYECHAGATISGVTLRGTVVKR